MRVPRERSRARIILVAVAVTVVAVAGLWTWRARGRDHVACTPIAGPLTRAKAQQAFLGYAGALAVGDSACVDRLTSSRFAGDPPAAEVLASLASRGRSLDTASFSISVVDERAVISVYSGTAAYHVTVVTEANTVLVDGLSGMSGTIG